jgi:hypothetical protein
LSAVTVAPSCGMHTGFSISAPVSPARLRSCLTNLRSGDGRNQSRCETCLATSSSAHSSGHDALVGNGRMSSQTVSFGRPLVPHLVAAGKLLVSFLLNRRVLCQLSSNSAILLGMWVHAVSLEPLGVGKAAATNSSPLLEQDLSSKRCASSSRAYWIALTVKRRGR